MLIGIIKTLLIVAIMAVLAYPFITGTESIRKYFIASKLNYKTPHNKKNIFFVLLAVLEFVVAVITFQAFDELAYTISNIPFVGKLFGKAVLTLNAQPQLNFIMFTIRLVLINVILIYAYIIAKAFLKNVILDPAFGLKKKKKKKKKSKGKDGDENTENTENKEGEEQPNDDLNDSANEKIKEEERKRKKLRIPEFLHSDDDEGDASSTKSTSEADDDLDDGDESKKEKKYYGPIESFILGLFFEGDNFEYAKDWVVRVRTILRTFVILVEITYALFFITVLISMFFPLPTKIYGFLLAVLRIGDWYLYPALSIFFISEICNLFTTKSRSPRKEKEEEEEKAKEQEIEDLEERLRKLLNSLKKHFDSEHSLRYYPEASQEDIPEYEPTNQTYHSALMYISKRMKLLSGRVVQSYMQCLDASFNKEHVYFASSFYSELGEYLVVYTYIRLLSGSRVVFIVSDPDERATLRTFISERLMQMTGTSKGNSWRIYTSDERLDQADILIASPEDFRDGDLTSQYSDFFEEVSNAIVLDADRMISLDSYLCPVMASCLKKSTNDHIRFIFLTTDLYKGFAARSLPRFFCVEPILSFSSAKENESVSYVLWNRESKSHRIYNKYGQKNTCLECMIAELACKHKIDGVRLITESSLDHAERKILLNCGVEINKLYRDVVNVNYMIYSDERANLAASMYACTRFRGRKKSVVHIISKPYLLREYFISKATTENFVNRSSFIQPRVLEHVDQHKLSLLRVFCKLTTENGLPLSTFQTEMCEVINICMESGYVISSGFCKKMLENKKAEELKTGELAAYLIAGLCDYDIYHTDEELELCAHRSVGHNAKEYYLIIDPANNDGFTLHREKYIIFNRAKEIFEMLFSCNKRVEMRLNNEIIGYLDTFPNRTHLEYIAGQSIVYRNAEYEIEHISEDGKTVYLRNENVKIRHCLSTVHLRRYELESITPIPKHLGVLNNTKLNLEEIRVTECFAKFTGETYGFYGLTSDKQTIDFYHKDGVDGNSHVSKPHIRNITDGRILKVDLITRMECTDGMRLLMAAVFNEFVRTIFPKSYHYISILPMLAEPLNFSKDIEPATELERIKTLYPYLINVKEEFIETDPHKITFFFINDCHEDVGAFQWFYDLSGRYMQEFLANIYSYLHWLQLRPEKEHYIYFGGTALPECYDLDGCCDLLEGFNLILSDLEEQDIETAGNDLIYDKIERCSFCHREMESGRFSFFDKARYICADCHDTVETEEHLAELYSEMKKYLETTYPHISFNGGKPVLDSIYSLTAEQVLSEFYYRMDYSERTIFTERDEPADNVRVSLLRGIIEMWQSDNQYFMDYSKAQLYYEELIFLHSKELHHSANWIYNALDETLRKQVDEIAEYTGVAVVYENPEENTDTALENNPDTPDNTNGEETTDESLTPSSSENAPAGADDTDKDNTDKENEEPSDSDSTDEGLDNTDENNGEGTVDDNSEENGVKTSFDFIRMKVKLMTPVNNDINDDDLFGDEKHTGLYDPNKIPRFWKRYLRDEKLDTGLAENLGDAEYQENLDPVDLNGDASDNIDGSEGEDQFNDQNTTDGTEPADNKKKKRRGLFGPKLSPGEKIQPLEEDEATNPRIRIYNEIVRFSYNYKEGPIETMGLSAKELLQILIYVLGDYPELFWVTRSVTTYTNGTFTLSFRCKDANGNLDVKQINSKRAALKKAAGKFTRGISKKTDPYDALTTLYRRLILNTDYDSLNLGTNVSNNELKDDKLRSLYSALVEHKVVCAGYAVALQYLLQSIGIVSGYVISEKDNEGTSHAFNILKLGKYCYYIDSTWGDRSDTETGDDNRDLVLYDYFCVPYSEFILTPPTQTAMHIPSKEYYPDMEVFNHTNHEYYRYRNAYLTSYNESEIIRIIADAAMEYEEKEMGEFTVGIRFANQNAASLACTMLLNKDTISRLISRAKDTITKKGKAKVLDRKFGIIPASESGVLYIRFTND